MAASGVGFGQAMRALWQRDERYRLTAFADEKIPVPLLRLAVVAARAQPIDESNRRTNSIFIHVPKAAGTSVTNGLGLPHKPHVAISRFFARDPAFAKQAFKFAIVRNPWDRFYSAFNFLRADSYLSPTDRMFADRYLRKYPDFEAFCRAMVQPDKRAEVIDYYHFLPQVHWLRLPGQEEHCMDYIGRLENISEAFDHIALRIGVDASLPFLNKTPKGDFRDAYTPMTRDVVADIYQDDIKAFGYAFEAPGDARDAGSVGP